MRGELERYVERVLGPCQVVGEHSWPHGEACVLEVRDRAGVRWFAKRHRRADKHRREVAAYRAWVPALGDRAPTLRAADDALQALVLSAVLGCTGSGVAAALDPAIQQQAGRLLRRLHEVAALGPWADFAAEQLAEFERWAARAAGLLDPRLLDFARSEVRGLSRLGSPLRVPCHLDYEPRNWLVADGQVSIIDFERARPEIWVNDLSRLYFGVWSARPELAAAFLAGYGRPIGRDDRAVLLGCGALSAVSTVVWAHAHDDESFAEAGRQRLVRLLARQH